MKEQTMSVAALIEDIRKQRRMFSPRHPQRRILDQCEAAVISLSVELYKAKQARSSWWMWIWRSLTGPIFSRVRVEPQKGLPR